MHKESKEYCEMVQEMFPEYFNNCSVLDVGSLDINGNNRYLFENCRYYGLDVIKGKNVDLVSPCHLVDLPNENFDTIISTNALEHDMYLKLTLKKMVDLLKPKGLLIICAANSWHEHGTLKKDPESSGTTQMGEAWANYYKNVVEDDFKDILDSFSRYKIKIRKNDITFWGFKK